MNFNISILNNYYYHFKNFIKEQNNIIFDSFSHPYIEEEENYKYNVHYKGRSKLNVLNWNSEDIGTGKIIKNVISAIEIPNNNLLIHDNRYGKSGRYHQSLYEALKERGNKLYKYEEILFNFYKNNINDKTTFNWILDIAGKKYAYLAYLFFLKDKRKYLPIAVDTFDDIFTMLEVDFKTSRKCSWSNYKKFNDLIMEVRDFLDGKLESEVQLLDAHSFLWIIGSNEFKKSIQITEKPEVNIENYTPKNPIIEGKSINTENKNNVTDFIELNRKNKIIGDQAEQLVIEVEKEFLIESGRSDLSEAVKLVSDNSSLGYDIISYDLDCNEEKIEVKAIKSVGSINSFYLSQNELNKSEISNNYYLYLVKNLNSKAPQILSIKNPDFSDNDKFLVKTVNYKIFFQ
jgi:hypothetical protein